MRFIRKHDLVEAVRWKGDNGKEIKAFVNVPVKFNGEVCEVHDDALVTVRHGDWLVKHPDGSYAAMDIQSFNQTYQLYSVNR